MARARVVLRILVSVFALVGAGSEGTAGVARRADVCAGYTGAAACYSTRAQAVPLPAYVPEKPGKPEFTHLGTFAITSTADIDPAETSVQLNLAAGKEVKQVLTCDAAKCTKTLSPFFFGSPLWTGIIQMRAEIHARSIVVDVYASNSVNGTTPATTTGALGLSVWILTGNPDSLQTTFTVGATAGTGTGAAARFAPNDFGPNGENVPAALYLPGEKQRTSPTFLRAYPNPYDRALYEHGGDVTNHDGPCRATIAYFAARYQRPLNGYEQDESVSPDGTVTQLADPNRRIHYDGPRPNKGGGEYASGIPTNPTTMIHNVWKFVQDITYPKAQPSQAKYDNQICTLILSPNHATNPSSVMGGTLDIGTPLDPMLPANDPEHRKFFCIETNLFFTSLVRELGFPARELNVLPYNNGTYEVQTAASQVWYDGAWHFYDPWESFLSPRDYFGPGGDAGYSSSGAAGLEIWVRALPVGNPDYDYRIDPEMKAGTNPHLNAQGWKLLETIRK